MGQYQSYETRQIHQNLTRSKSYSSSKPRAHTTGSHNLSKSHHGKTKLQSETENYKVSYKFSENFKIPRSSTTNSKKNSTTHLNLVGQDGILDDRPRSISQKLVRTFSIKRLQHKSKSGESILINKDTRSTSTTNYKGNQISQLENYNPDTSLPDSLRSSVTPTHIANSTGLSQKTSSNTTIKRKSSILDKITNDLANLNLKNISFKTRSSKLREFYINSDVNLPVIEFNRDGEIINNFVEHYLYEFERKWNSSNIDSNSHLSDYKILKCLGKGTFGEVHLAIKYLKHRDRDRDRDGMNRESRLNHNNNNNTSLKEYEDRHDFQSSDRASSHKSSHQQQRKSQPITRNSINNTKLQNIPIAIKTLNIEKMKRLKQTDHVRNERRILYALDCKFCVKLIETFQTSKELHLVMEFVSGGELFYYMHQKKIFTVSLSKFYVSQIILALHHLHILNIIYRDLKPENILLSSQNGYLKLTDFGFAKRLKNLTARAWTLCGTPDFLAPEIILSKGYSYGVDFWAVGVLLYEMLVGRTPFINAKSEGDSPMEIYQRIVKVQGFGYKF